MEFTSVSKSATIPMVLITASATKATGSVTMAMPVKVSTKLTMFSVCTSVYNADVDECREQYDECDQDCKNIDGSYLCGCSSGFLLDTNGRSCNGKLP